MLQAAVGTRTWRPEDSREAQDNYREASGCRADERWIQGPASGVRAYVFAAQYASRDGGIFVRPVGLTAPGEEFAAWQAASAAAFRLVEGLLDEDE